MTALRFALCAEDIDELMRDLSTVRDLLAAGQAGGFECQFGQETACAAGPKCPAGLSSAKTEQYRILRESANACCPNIVRRVAESDGSH